jgi:hypothetical protein
MRGSKRRTAASLDQRVVRSREHHVFKEMRHAGRDDDSQAVIESEAMNGKTPRS